MDDIIGRSKNKFIIIINFYKLVDNFRVEILHIINFNLRGTIHMPMKEGNNKIQSLCQKIMQ